MRKFFYNKKGENTFRIETGKLPRFVIGLEFGSGDGDNITFEIGLYWHLWLSYSAPWIAKRFGRDEKYRETNIEFRWQNGGDLRLSLWGNHGMMSSSHRIRHWSVNLMDFFFGRQKHTMAKEEAWDNWALSLPEGLYMAAVKYTLREWRRPRLPFIKRHEGIEFTIPGGIPVEGKGENSWDCGMDAIFSASREYKDSVRTAADEFVLSVLKTRMRYSQLHHYTMEKLSEEGFVIDQNRYITRMPRGRSIGDMAASDAAKITGSTGTV